jgi:hypothetical protein
VAVTPETEERVAKLAQELFQVLTKYHVPGKFNLDVMACAIMLVSMQVARSGVMAGRKDDIDAAVRAAIRIFEASVDADMQEVNTTTKELFGRLGLTFH